jgi:hypothetical protein
MNKDLNHRAEKLEADALEKVTGGNGNEFDPEKWEAIFEEAKEQAENNNKINPEPHNKDHLGNLSKIKK